MTKKEYNEIPVVYCAHCHSLKVMTIEDMDMCYCAECGSTDMCTGNIYQWLEEENNKNN